MVSTRVVLPSPAPWPRKRILLLHTGGTLGGLFADHGDNAAPSGRASTAPLPVAQPLNQAYGDSPDFGSNHHTFTEDLWTHCREIFDLADLTVQVLSQADSSNLGADDWRVLAEVMVQRWDEFDAFLVVHGTDTLAYCSSYLSLTLQDPSKPIVVTGSQRPLRELRSDARMNLIDAVQLASLALPGVFVAFDSNVYLGSRVAKTSNLELGAFQSPNFPALGHFGVEIELNTALLPFGSSQATCPLFDPRAESDIMSLGIVPGGRLPLAVRQAVLSVCNGLVLEGFGLGHAPTRHSDWMELCEEAYAQGIPVLMVSPCRRGRVDMGLYPVGQAYRDRGVMSASDMTRECATVKLMLMLGRNVPFAERHTFMATPLERETAGAMPEGVRP